MKNFKQCENCKEYHWTDKDCEPIYLVYHEDYLGDDPKEIRAAYHEDAAIKYAEYYNQDDYPLMDGGIITVRVEKDGIVKCYEVGAEQSIHYSSNEVTQ